MKERPILFNGDMVRAILDGRKTQTRRVVKHLPLLGEPEIWCRDAMCNDCNFVSIVGDYRRFCPHGAPGDRLWVKETFVMWPYAGNDGAAGEIYKADNQLPASAPKSIGRNWTPSIHMPRWASRITLEITDVRVERLQDITWQDVLAEGVKHKDAWWLGALHPIKDTPKVYPLAAQAYESIWDSIYAAKHPWSSNPWVWAITFRRVEV